jgi:hypothetical protein
MRTLLAVGLALSVTVASAQDRSDFKQIADLQQRAAQLNLDILSAEKGYAVRSSMLDVTCFGVARTDATLLTSQSLRLMTVIFIAVQMRDPDDARVVTKAVNDIAKELLENIRLSRPRLNELPGACPSNSFLSAKVQELLNLYTSADPVLRRLSTAFKVS